VATTLAVVVAVAVGGTAISIMSAESTGGGPGSFLTVPQLSEAGGGTAVLGQTAAFTYVFLLAVFIAAVAQEFTRGTFRTMLLHQPARTPLLWGKVSVLVAYTIAATVVAGVVCWVTARLIAPSQGIDTSAWTSLDALGAAATDLGRVALFVTGTAIFATTIGVLARSVPIGVGAALIWSGPIENIVGDSWSGAEQWFPGLLLRSIVAPGSTSTSTARAVTTLAAYAVVALAITSVALRRRDVTS
jgi:ABC-type transport system involved in multi-copper enzyme maturation permease subunit